MSKLINKLNNFSLSVIIPFYNRAKLFDKLFLKIDKFNKKEVEFIFVDDGSTIKLKKNIQKLIKTKTNFRLISLKQNCGPGIARNQGIKKAKGNYVLFLDSDDFLVQNNFNKLLEFIRNKKNSDLIFYDYLKQKNNMKINISKKKLNKNKIIKLFLKTEIEMCSNFYCFKKNFLEKNNIEFQKGYYEDIVFMLKCFFYMKKYEIFNHKVYLKKFNKKSITNNFTDKHLIDFIFSTKNKNFFFKKIIKKKYKYHENAHQFGLRGDYIFAKKIWKKANSFISVDFINNVFKKILNNKYKVLTSYDKKVKKELFN